MDTARLRDRVGEGCRHLLGQQQRDPFAPTHGCFDRRYWGWKLADFPDATLQRAVLPLSWLLHEMRADAAAVETLADAVTAGLLFAARIQHRDGSFDQIFPHEHSFGANAFLVHPLLAAYHTVQDRVGEPQRRVIENSLFRAADFLCRHDERHGRISNHLAGAVLSLTESGTAFSESRFHDRAAVLLEAVLDSQSAEGWFPEYGSADPGYQTLCVHYLAQVQRAMPSTRLQDALGRALEFLAWFAHPDGTFAGEYGSRRTAVCYPGGFGLLASRFPLARSLFQFIARSASEGRTVTPLDVDAGNQSPLLESWIVALDAATDDGEAALLPYERPSAQRDFAAAGLFVRGTATYYAVAGASNGGVLKVFDKREGRIAWDDGGYVGRLEGKGTLVTSQAPPANVHVEDCRLTVTTPFVHLAHPGPAPMTMAALRLWGIVGMWNTAMREWTKTVLVKLLITGTRRAPLRLTRTIEFGAAAVHVDDRVSTEGRRVSLAWLRCGRPFRSIHMASAGYFQGFTSTGGRELSADVAALRERGEWSASTTVPA